MDDPEEIVVKILPGKLDFLKFLDEPSLSTLIAQFAAGAFAA